MCASGSVCSGKSTLLNIIGGIDSADEGNLVIDGERLADMSEKNLSLYRRKHLVTSTHLTLPTKSRV